MIKRILLSLFLVMMLGATACAADDPIAEDVYLSNIHGKTANFDTFYADEGQISDVLFKGDVLPVDDNIASLGSEALKFKEIHVTDIYTSNNTFYIDGIKVDLTAVGGGVGPQGPPGADGITPVKGVDYFDGTPGADGADGSNGADGAPGPNLIDASTNTSFTGLLKGDGVNVALAVAGTDYATTANITTAVNDHEAAYTHSDIAHTNRTVLDDTQEAFTTALKADYDGAVSQNHTHSNIAVLNGTQESFTTALKTAYDTVVTAFTSAWKTIVDNHIANASNPHSVTKAQVGLGACDNTSDLGKPISTLTQTALDGKQATLVSATNIKAINGSSVLGSGDLVVGGADSRLIVDAVNGGEQHDVTASVALTNVAVIDIPLTAGTYTFQYYVIYRSNQLTNGIRLAVNYTGTNGAFVWNWRGNDLIGTASSLAADQDSILAAGAVPWEFASRAKSTTTRGTTISVDTINADMFAIIEGVFIATGSGDLELWHGSEVATAAYTTSVMPGTSVIVTKTK